jgi:hypothetical protein
MSIAQDRRLVSHVKLLPPHWGTLYALTRLDDAAFEDGVENGRIHPDMQRSDVDELVRRDRYRQTMRTIATSTEPATAAAPPAPAEPSAPPAQDAQAPQSAEPDQPRPALLPTVSDPERDRVFADLLKIRRADGWLAAGDPYMQAVFDAIDRWQAARANPPRMAC